VIFKVFQWYFTVFDGLWWCFRCFYGVFFMVTHQKHNKNHPAGGPFALLGAYMLRLGTGLCQRNVVFASKNNISL